MQCISITKCEIILILRCKLLENSHCIEFQLQIEDQGKHYVAVMCCCWWQFDDGGGWIDHPHNDNGGDGDCLVNHPDSGNGGDGDCWVDHPDRRGDELNGQEDSKSRLDAFGAVRTLRFCFRLERNTKRFQREIQFGWGEIRDEGGGRLTGGPAHQDNGAIFECTRTLILHRFLNNPLNCNEF